MKVTASDGEWETETTVTVNIKSLTKSGLKFPQDRHVVQVTENSSRPQRLIMLQVLGSSLGEHVVFRFLKSTDHFDIGPSSGIISTTGKEFDREDQSKYLLVVEV